MKTSVIAAVAALALAGVLVSAPFAQTDAPSDGTMGMMGGGCPMMGMMGRGKMGRGMMRGHGRMAAVMEGRLAYLKAELDITDTQKLAWDGYAEAVKDRVEVMKGMRQTMMAAMHSGSAVERMDARIAGMEVMVDAMKAVKPATEKLYAAMTDAQKKKADELIGMDCGAM